VRAGNDACGVLPLPERDPDGVALPGVVLDVWDDPREVLALGVEFESSPPPPLITMTATIRATTTAPRPT
jgi:hypothetical protein